MSAVEGKAGFEGDLTGTLIRKGRASEARDLNKTPLLAKLRLAVRRAFQ
jgi:hypothetical protein